MLKRVISSKNLFALESGYGIDAHRYDQVSHLQETTRLFHRLASYRREKAIFLLAYRHGLRASEVGMLRIEDIDFKTLRIMIHRLKGSHSGEHPLQPDEAKAIKGYLRERGGDSPILFTSNRGDPIARRTLDWLMKKHGGAIELPEAK